MTEYFYMFEYGSGSTWATYLVPVSAYRLYRGAKGELVVSAVVPSAVEMRDVKNLQVISSEELRQAVKHVMVSKETSQ